MLTVRDVAERLRLSPSKVYELVAGNILAHHKIGGAIRVSEAQLDALLETTKREREPIPAKRKPSRTRLRHLRI